MKRFLTTLLALAFFCLIITPCHAAILRVASEDTDVTLTGTVSIASSSAGVNFRSGWGRIALQASGTNSAVDPPTNRITLPTFANQSTIWVHAELYNAGSAATVSNNQGIRVYGSDGVARIIIRGTGTSGQVKISTRNTAGTITDLVTCTSGTLPTTSLAQIDFFLNYAVSGQATLYANSVQICTFSGDVTTNSVTAVNQVEFGEWSVNGTSANWSEMIVADADTRSMGLRTLVPVAAGTTQSFTPNTVANVNPAVINDANFVSTTSNNALSQWTVGSLPSGTYDVLDVVQVARVIIGTGGPQNFTFSQHIGGADTTVCSPVPTLSFATYSCDLGASKPGGGAWSTSDFAGINFGIESLP